MTDCSRSSSRNPLMNSGTVQKGFVRVSRPVRVLSCAHTRRSQGPFTPSKNFEKYLQRKRSKTKMKNFSPTTKGVDNSNGIRLRRNLSTWIIIIKNCSWGAVFRQGNRLTVSRLNPVYSCSVRIPKRSFYDLSNLLLLRDIYPKTSLKLRKESGSHRRSDEQKWC